VFNFFYLRRQEARNYPHYLLQGDKEAVMNVEAMIEKMYAEKSSHVTNHYLSRALPAAMVNELQIEYGDPNDVRIEQKTH
jgi:hypothetical protein